MRKLLTAVAIALCLGALFGCGSRVASGGNGTQRTVCTNCRAAY